MQLSGVDIRQLSQTGHAVLIAAHHDPGFLNDRNFGMVIGIEYLAAVLERNGWSVDLICGPRGERDLSRCLRGRKTSFVGISSTTPAYRHAERLGRVVRETAPDTPVILGGYHASIYRGEVLRRSDAFDIVAVGEGEYIVEDLVSGTPLSEIQGLAFRRDGRVVETAARAPIADLDSLPWPARGRFHASFRMEESFGMYPHVGLGGPDESAYVVTTRGCNNRCAFCRSSCIPALRTRSVSNVVQEIEALASNGVRLINFTDPNFLHDASRAEDLARCLAPLNLRWICMARPEAMTERLCRIMVASGCALAEVGIETINPELRRGWRKTGTPEDIRRGLACAGNAGLVTMALMMIGPAECLSYIENDIDFVIDAGVDFVRVCPLTYYPGTELWAAARRSGRIQSDWTERAIPVNEILTEIPEAWIARAVGRYFRRFYYRPRYLLRHLFKILLRRNWPVRRVTFGIAHAFMKTMLKSLLFQSVQALRTAYRSIVRAISG